MEKCIGCELCAGVCPADCIYVRGARQPARPPGLARRALRLRLRDQLPALHPLRHVRRGLPDRGHHRVEAVRVLLHQPVRRHLHQGRAAGGRRRHARSSCRGRTGARATTCMTSGWMRATVAVGQRRLRGRGAVVGRARLRRARRPRAASAGRARRRGDRHQAAARRCSRPTCSTRTSRWPTGACRAGSGGPGRAARNKQKLEATRGRMKELRAGAQGGQGRGQGRAKRRVREGSA